MDGIARGIQETLSQLETSQNSLPSAAENESYTCDCGNVIHRMFFPFSNKGKGGYIFPHCPCKIAAHEKFVEAQERLYRKRQLEKAYRHNIMNDRLKEARFDNFTIRPGTQLIYDKTKEFAESFDLQKVGLVGYGVPGNGKSHLFAAIHHRVDEQGHISLFLDCSQLFNIAEDAKKYSSKVTISEIINAAIGCDLLTLDELGSGKITSDEFTDILFPILNGRQGKITNFTTNLDLDELYDWLATDKYGKPLDKQGRLIDRIIGSCDVVKNNGTSKRQEDAAMRFNAQAAKDPNRKYA